MKKISITIILIIVIFVGFKLLRPIFVDDSVNESLPEEFVLPTDEEFSNMSDVEKSEMEMKMVEMFSDKNEEVKEDMGDDTGSKIVKKGNLKDADNFHKGSGTVLLFESDSWKLLRLENLVSTNGPDLKVVLSTHPDPKNADDLGDYLDLGKLKGNIGNQNYEIPQNIDLTIYNSAVIYCKAFRIIFSTATLK